MNVALYGGPYDGTTLDHNDINLYTTLLPVGTRKFLSLPPRKDWDAVRRGDLEKNSPFDGNCPIYELVRSQDRIEGRYDLDGTTLATAIRDQRQGIEPVPQIELAGQYFKCYRGDLRDVSLSENCFEVTDEKDRRWMCVAVSNTEGSKSGFAEALSYMGGEQLTEPLRMVILHCGDRSELPAKLADQID